MTRSAAALAGWTVIAGVLTGGCADWFGDENSTPAKFEVVIANMSDQWIYFSFGQADATQLSGRAQPVGPGKTLAVGIGVAAPSDEPGGCFKQPLWITTSTSDQRYGRGDVAEYADDLEISDTSRQASAPTKNKSR
jgi:hypothetical protein